MINCLICCQSFIPRISYLKILSLIKKSEKSICAHCIKKFEDLGEIRFKFCSKKLPKADICDDCKTWQKIYQKDILINHSIYKYNDFFHDLMVNYKRYGDYVLYRVLEQLCMEELSGLNFDYYVPIPTSKDHQERRQFDTISSIYQNIVPLSYALEKMDISGSQGEKNRIERLATPQSFLVEKDNEKFQYKDESSFLLLDDIYTTGRTLYHARDALRSVFPKAKIESFSICR